jgi:hypothetical protein
VADLELALDPDDAFDILICAFRFTLWRASELSVWLPS